MRAAVGTYEYVWREGRDLTWSGAIKKGLSQDMAFELCVERPAGAHEVKTRSGVAGSMP